MISNLSRLGISAFLYNSFTRGILPRAWVFLVEAKGEFECQSAGCLFLFKGEWTVFGGKLFTLFLEFQFEKEFSTVRRLKVQTQIRNLFYLLANRSYQVRCFLKSSKVCYVHFNLYYVKFKSFQVYTLKKKKKRFLNINLSLFANTYFRVEYNNSSLCAAIELTKNTANQHVRHTCWLFYMFASCETNIPKIANTASCTWAKFHTQITSNLLVDSWVAALWRLRSSNTIFGWEVELWSTQFYQLFSLFLVSWRLLFLYSSLSEEV